MTEWSQMFTRITKIFRSKWVSYNNWKLKIANERGISMLPSNT